jgi:molybdopterin converting factor small subunit
MPPSAPASTLNVRVLLFASYAELLGRDAVELALERPATVGTAVDRLRSLPGAERLPVRLLCALNLSQASPDDVLSPGDELAILPPMSGG